MKKTTILAIAAIPAMTFANNYFTFISKKDHSYEVGEIQDPGTPPPVDQPLDYSFQTWKDVSAINLSDFHPMSMDTSSKNQAHYKINVGQEPFKGNPAGFKPYDENYDVANLKNCHSNQDGFCSAGNLNQVFYDKKHSSGQYYFEIEAKGQAHADCLGFSKSNVSAPSRMDRFGVCSVGNQSYGMKWDLNNTYSEYSHVNLQPTGTVYQVWVDYDKEIVSIMELGTDQHDYTNYNIQSEDAAFMKNIPWVHIHHTMDLGNLKPAIYDGTRDANAKFSFNFGQEPFAGDHTGFKPYDPDYNPSVDKANWTGVHTFYDEDRYLQPANNSVAYYNKTYTSGKYYFEVRSEFLTTAPDYEAIGFYGKSGYYNIVGAVRTGSNRDGYELGIGNGTYPKFKSSGNQPGGSIFRVFIDYDKGLISVMVFGSSKNDYENYVEVF